MSCSYVNNFNYTAADYLCLDSNGSRMRQDEPALSLSPVGTADPINCGDLSIVAVFMTDPASRDSPCIPITLCGSSDRGCFPLEMLVSRFGSGT